MWVNIVEVSSRGDDLEFSVGIVMHAHFKSSFLYGIRLMQSHLCMVVIDCNTICFSTWAVISCLKLVSNAEVIVG